jgi:hypothetical protein
LETRLLPNIDFSSGFFGAGSNVLAVNGSAHTSGPVLQLTEGQVGQIGSAFSSHMQDIVAFSTGFSFQLLNPDADGFTFCIQGGSAAVLGPGGGGLGYGPDHTGGTGGIADSLAIKFDLFDNQGEGSNSTGLYTNGAAPTNVGATDLGASGIDLHSGHVFRVGMTYDGTTLKVTTTDTTTGTSANQSYTINIQSQLGNNIDGFVGFTGATGGLTATENILNWSFVSGMPTPPAAPGGPKAVAASGHVFLSWMASTGAFAYNVYRSTTSGNETLFQSGVTSTSITDNNVLEGTTYFYKVTAVGVGGESPLSASTEVSAMAGPFLDFSPGFANAAGVVMTNGSAKFNGSALRLTDGQPGEAASAFADAKQDITVFENTFSFQLTDAVADGFTFCIQNNASTAVGPPGGGLGYGPDHTGGTGGIANSVALKFDLFDNQGEGSNSTGVYTNGAAPTNVGSIDLGPSGIDLHSGHIFNVSIIYDSPMNPPHTLAVTLTDTNTGASNSHNYVVDIAATVGATTAFVGFTGATGGLSAAQNILNWTFLPLV